MIRPVADESRFLTRVLDRVISVLSHTLITMSAPATTRMAMRALNGATRHSGSVNSFSPVVVVARRSLSSSTSKLQSAAPAAPTGQASPFVEAAGRNPAEDSAPFSAQLQEYGAWM